MNLKPFTKKKPLEVCTSYGMTTPTEENSIQRQNQIEQMQIFLATATQQWDVNRSIKRFCLPNGEAISCVLYDNVFFISGTDIVRSLTFRFHAFGRPVTNPKKFEEGVFSDLRNLKPGSDARLEDPKSDLLDMLYKNNCIRTQKKQKVFFWFSVPHDRLFLDALERDLKREKIGLESTTNATVRPAILFSLDSTQELLDDLRKNMSKVTPTNDLWNDATHQLETKRMRVPSVRSDQKNHTYFTGNINKSTSNTSSKSSTSTTSNSSRISLISKGTPADSPAKSQFMHYDNLSAVKKQIEFSNSKSVDLKKQRALFGSLSLLDGSPSYKQRRRRTISSTQSPTSPVHTGRRHDNCHHSQPAKTNFSRVASFGSPPPLKPTHCKQPKSTNSRLAMAASKAGYNKHKTTHWQPAQPIEIENWDQKPIDMAWENVDWDKSLDMNWESKQIDLDYKSVNMDYKPVEMNYKPAEMDYKPTDMEDMDWQETKVKSEKNECSQMPKFQSLFEKEVFTCGMCGKIFTESEYLQDHQKAEHSLKYSIDKDDNQDNNHDDNHDRISYPVMFNYGQSLFNNSQTNQQQSQHEQNQWDLLGFSGYDQPTIYNPILSATSSTKSFNQYYDDDLSSSTTSSPPDTFHSMKLLSSFKPLQDQEEDLNQYNLIYASFINTPDMNFAFA